MNNIKVFDENCMTCFCDGTCYEIDNVIVDIIEGDKLEGRELLKFIDVVSKFKSDYKFEVVYYNSGKCEYYFIALLGFKDDDFEWTDEFNEIHDNLLEHLKNNNINFG